LPGVLVYRLVLLGGITDDLVIHISDIHYMLEVEAALAKCAPQDVHGHKGTEIADVAIIIDGWPAGIHADGVVHRRRKFLHLAGKRVVKMKGQAFDSRRCFAARSMEAEIEWIYINT